MGTDQNNISIREASISDLDSLTDFLLPEYANTYPNDRGITREMFENDIFKKHLRDYLNEKLQDTNSFLLIAKNENSILGTIGIEFIEELPEVWGFYVDAKLHKHGIGSELWDYLLNHECLKDNRKLKLVVAQDCKLAKAFYEKRGFIVVSEEVWFWPSWVDVRIQNQYWVMEN